MLLFSSDQHLGTRGDTLFYDGGITDAAPPGTTREREHENHLIEKDVDSRCLICYLLQFCLCLLKKERDDIL